MKMFSPIRMITAVFFLIGAALGAPAPVSDAGLSVGQTAYAAQVSAKEQSPSYWQMYYNFAPPTDEFIAGLAAEQHPVQAPRPHHESDGVLPAARGGLGRGERGRISCVLHSEFFDYTFFLHFPCLRPIMRERF